MLMSVQRSELIGKHVYDQQAKLIGEVVDVVLKIGEKEISLSVRTPGGTSLEVPWDKVAAVKDIILLKEAVELPPEAIQPATAIPEAAVSAPRPKIEIPFLKRREERICPYCGKPATWIPQYQRWYCYNCQRYL